MLVLVALLASIGCFAWCTQLVMRRSAYEKKVADKAKWAKELTTAAAQNAADLAAARASRYLAGPSKPRCPAMFDVLLGIPSVRVVRLNDRPFGYAVAAGNRIILVHVSTPQQALPELDGSVSSWRERIQQAVSAGCRPGSSRCGQ